MSQIFLFKNFDGAIDNYSELASERGLVINMDIPAKLEVIGDSLRLLQVFNTLLANAFKYSKKDVEVKITYPGEKRLSCIYISIE